MTKLKRPIKALIIDDEQAYSTSLAGSAKLKQIIIESKTNLEDGIEFIAQNRGIDFVILDGKCFVNQDQEASGSTASNVPQRAMKLIEDINRDQNRHIQYCVNTGYFEDLESSLEGIFTVFQKDDSDDMFEHIIEKVASKEEYKLKNKYNECFEVFDLGIIDSKYEYLLIDALNCLENNDFRKKNLNTLRDLLEAIYLGLINQSKIPQVLLKPGGLPNLEWCTLFFEGRSVKYDSNDQNKQVSISKRIPRDMQCNFRKLKDGASAYSHLNDTEMLKYPYLATIYALLDLLVWLSNQHKTGYSF